MRSVVTIASILMLFLSASYVSAQDDVFVSRSTACSINPGYTMADVVDSINESAKTLREDATEKTGTG